MKKIKDLQTLIDSNVLPKRLALAVSQDAHSLEAVNKAFLAGLIDPVLVGSKVETLKIAQELNLDFSGATFIDEIYPSKAVETAVKLVNEKKADFLMKGNIPTPALLKAVLNKEWGLRTGNLLSHFALFETENYHKLIAVTDVAMNIAPNLKDKIGIINNAVTFMYKLGIYLPKVAIIAAIETVNENMQATLDAAMLSIMNKRGQINDCVIDGPLAFDNAISVESASHKKIKSEVAGDADLLIMPNIEAGNVLYKSLVWFAKAKVASVILGASSPIVLTSRSDSEECKFDSILLATRG
ncbi:MAG: bifunctional enoyl-CoA hydratase/phosphate acetyltransferase [Marinilabiliaceae bacterium]|nr:bifunctional enoyl-CoA hydratase/phosphate acetyltransferase [Marinilabiliaceae bacterium]